MTIQAIDVCLKEIHGQGVNFTIIVYLSTITTGGNRIIK